MSSTINILLADDDADDRFFFEEVLNEISLTTSLKAVPDGVSLMQFFCKATELPDVLFLDINMPRKGGCECLQEIRKDSRLSSMVVVMYSTSFNPTVIKSLRENGANYYIRKPGEFSTLKRVILNVLSLIVGTPFIEEEKDVVKLC